MSLGRRAGFGAQPFPESEHIFTLRGIGFRRLNEMGIKDE